MFQQFAASIPRTQHSCTHGYYILQQKDTKNQQREKVQGVKSGWNQAQAPKGTLPVELHRTCLICSSTNCDNTCEIVPAREAH